MNDLENYAFPIDDVNLPHSLRRSIWLIKDEEDGNNYTADEILDDKPQDIIINMRAIINAGYQSREPKYVCPFCKEPVGLKIRTHEGDFFPFFSHYQDSDDSCPLKTTNEIDPSRLIITAENQFKESILHQDMVAKLKEILILSQSFKEIEMNKVISTPEVTGYRRPSLYSVYRDEEKVCFDALVSNPLIGLLVGRNAFYKMQKMFYLWVFPDFSTKYQRMSEKDILYMNKRNVFVFDSLDYYKNATDNYLGDKIPDHLFAYEESLRQKRLMLNCYWQVPLIDEKGNVSILWKGPELVAFDDILLDKNSYEAYYHDSDQDFYHSYSPEKQRLIDEWMRIKEDRWKKIFDSIEKRKMLYEQALARKEKRERLAYYYPLIESGEITPEAFQDENSKLWGYKVDNIVVISPQYYDAKPFIACYAWVRKKEKWGVINYKGVKNCNFQYNNVSDLSNGLYSAFDGSCYILINYKGKEFGRGFDAICQFSNGEARAQKKGNWSKIDEKGNEIYEKTQLSNGLIKYYSPFLKKYGLLSKSYDNNLDLVFNSIEDLCDGRIRAMKNGKWGLLNEEGEEIWEKTPLGNGYYKYYSAFDDRYGIMSNEKGQITRPEYRVICDFYDGKAWASKYLKWGVINIEGKTIVDFEYDKLDDFVNNLSVVCQRNDTKEYYQEWNRYRHQYERRFHYVTKEKWGLVDRKGDILIPLSDRRIFIRRLTDKRTLIICGDSQGLYDENGKEIIPIIYNSIGPFFSGKAIAQKNYKYGLINIDGKELTPFEYDEMKLFSDNRIIARKMFKWGIINDNGHPILPFDYDKIGELVDGKAVIKNGEKIEVVNIEGNIITPEIQEKDVSNDTPSTDIEESCHNAFEYTTLSNGMIKYNYPNVHKYGLMTSVNKKVTDMIFDDIYDYNDGCVRVKKGDRWGYINEKGEEVYDKKTLSNGLFEEISRLNNNCRLLDSNNGVIVDFYYNYIDDFAGGYAKVKKGCNWGVIDEQGKEKVPCTYDEIGRIQDGKMKAKDGCLWGVIDINNNPIVPLQYNELGEYRKGKIKARLSGKWGFVDGDGGRGISFIYDDVHDYSENRAICVIDGMYGAIDQRGKMRIPFEYEEIKDFCEGIAIAVDDNSMWGALGENGNVIIPFEFNEIYSFKDGRARARKGDLWGFINDKGDPIIPFIYFQLEDYKDGKARAILDGDGYIDEKGNEIIERYQLSNGNIKEVAPLSCKCRLLNPDGSELKEKIYSEIKDFVDGKAIAAIGSSLTDNGKWGVIDENGKELIPFEYDSISYLDSGKYAAKMADGHGWQKKYKSRLLNSDGSEVTRKLFCAIHNFVDGKSIAVAYNTRKWGVIDENGKELIPFEYDSITYLAPEKYEVMKVIRSEWRKSRKEKLIINLADAKSDSVDVKSSSKIDIQRLNSEEVYHAIVTGRINMGVFIKIPSVGKGLIPKKEIVKAGNSMKDFKKGDNVDVMLLHVNTEKQQATFKLISNNMA